MRVRKLFFGFSLTLFIVVTFSCSKNKVNTPGVNECLTTAPTIRTIINGEGAIQDASGKFFIIEKNTIDGRLYPCNLPPEFKTDKLSVKFNGDVKKSVNNTGPCCTENIVILKIARL